MKKTVKLAALMMALTLILCSCGQSGETPVYSQGLEDNGYYTGIKALDHVTLPDYSTIDIPADELREGVEYYLSYFAPHEEVTDRAVEDGDTVNIEYIGYVDGEAFEGGSTGEGGTNVTIGVTSYIDDFIEQLIGHMPGDSFDVNVTFPDPYTNNEELSGKDAVFKTKINYIQGDIDFDACDDAFVADNFEYYGWTSLKDIEDYCKLNYAANYVFESASVSEIPDAVREHTVALIMETYRTSADSYGMTFDEMLETYLQVKDEAEFREMYSDYIESEASYPLIYQAIAEKEGLKVKKADIRDFFKENYGSSYYTDAKNTYGLGYLAYVTLHDMVEEALAGHVAVH